MDEKKDICISCRDVSLYDNRKNKLLDHINLEIERGKVYGIVGRNGSGKTMLFRAICGLWKISEGKIEVDHQVIGKDIDFIKDAGISIGETAFIGNLSGLDNLLLLADINKKIEKKDIFQTLEIVLLDREKKKKYRKYSLGMKQKLRLAQAFMEHPSVLILDEPFNGLDSIAIKQIREYLLEQKKSGVTILIASHMAEDIEILCIYYIWKRKLGERNSKKDVDCYI